MTPASRLPRPSLFGLNVTFMPLEGLNVTFKPNDGRPNAGRINDARWAEEE
jgi:hypothetical protein